MLGNTSPSSSYSKTIRFNDNSGKGCPRNLSPKRGVSVFRELAKEKLFNDSNIHELEIKNRLRSITAAYEQCKLKFVNKYRENGERYFDHLKNVAIIILEKLPNPNIEKLGIGILHDIIEDTNIDFDVLEKIYGANIAIGTQAISKNKPYSYINNEVEKNIILESGILDENNDLKNEITKKAKKGELSEIENKAFKIFSEYKEKRNKEYFSHMKSFELMLEHIKNIATSNNIELSEGDLIEITQNALDVKFADRINNLATQWNPDNVNKVLRKIEETKKYILPIAKETNIDAYKLLCDEIEKLEKIEIHEEGKLVCLVGEIKGKVHEIL